MTFSEQKNKTVIQISFNECEKIALKLRKKGFSCASIAKKIGIKESTVQMILELT